MKTLMEHRKPFDIRTAPIWAIPQLRWLNRQKNVTVTDFRRVEGSNCAWVVVYVENMGVYHGIVKKKNMNSPGPITLTWGVF